MGARGSSPITARAWPSGLRDGRRPIAALAVAASLAGLITGTARPADAAPLAKHSEPRAAATAQKAGIACAKGWRYVRRVAPRACVHFGPGQGFAGGVNLERLRWRGWGRPRARAVGIERGFHEPLMRLRVRVVVGGLSAGCGPRNYSWLDATTRYGRVRVLLNCPGERTL